MINHTPCQLLKINVNRLVFGFMLCLLLASKIASGQSGKEITESRCTICHDLPDAAALSDEQWGIQLETMADYAGLSGKEKANVLEYVTSHERQAVTITSMDQEQKLFQQKCSLCHSTNRVLLMPLTPESRKHIIERMQARAPNWISTDEVHEILEYLNHGAPGSDKPVRKTIAGGPEAIFRERCTTCHTAERVYLQQQKGGDKGTAVVWGHVVNRMREKAPEWITDSEAEQILKYLSSIKPVKDK